MPEGSEVLRPEHHVEVLGELTADDLGSLEEILVPAFDSISPGDLAEFVPKAIEADSAGVIVARSPEGKIVSALVVNLDYRMGKLRGKIDDVATHEAYRKQGYAGAVLDYALTWFKEHQVKRVDLTSNDGREPSHAPYESRGFEKRDTNHFQLDFK